VVLALFGACGGDGTAGNGPGQFKELYNVATDCVGNVYVTDKANWRVQKLGDPAFGRPVCPPAVTAGTARLAGRVASAELTCDRPCRARAALVVAGRHVAHGRERVLPAGGSVRVTVRVPRRLPRGRAALRLTGSGAPGAVGAVSRRLTLPR
jgi:hypothetical protein